MVITRKLLIRFLAVLVHLSRGGKKNLIQVNNTGRDFFVSGFLHLMQCSFDVLLQICIPGLFYNTEHYSLGEMDSDLVL